MKNWKIDQLKSELSSRGDVKGWAVFQTHTQRRERYFMMDGGALALDQDRDSRSESVHLQVFVRSAKPGRQGEILKKLSTAVPLDEQLDSAIQAAKQTDHQAWDLPTEIPSGLPELKTSDPRMAEDLEKVMAELTDRISRSVGKKRDTNFNSSELFLSLHDRTAHLSNGVTHRSSQSRIYVEAAYSKTILGSDGKPRSDEYLNTSWSVSLEDMPIEKLFDETSERAEASLETEKPRTGTYPVIVDSEVLATLLGGYISHLSAQNSYLSLPFQRAGEELIPGAEGDLLTLTLDPSLPFGADTVALSDDGLVQRPLRIVEKNRVIATLADKRHSDWLNIPASTVRGNLVVEPGTWSFLALTQAGPLVIEILQFSGLFADPISGTFSSEIRLAKLHDNINGTVTYLKGGSLSGSIVENFRKTQLSDKRVKRSSFSSDSPAGHGYFGPEFALLGDVSIVG